MVCPGYDDPGQQNGGVKFEKKLKKAACGRLWHDYCFFGNFLCCCHHVENGMAWRKNSDPEELHMVCAR